MDTVSCTEKEPFLKSNWTFFCTYYPATQGQKNIKDSL